MGRGLEESLQLDTATRELNARKEREGQLGKEKKGRSPKRRDLMGTEVKWLVVILVVFRLLQAGLVLLHGQRPPGLLTRRHRVFLPRARIDGFSSFSSSLSLGRGWSVVISTRDGHPRQDGGGWKTLPRHLSPPRRRAQEGARLSIETFAAAIGHRLETDTHYAKTHGP